MKTFKWVLAGVFVLFTGAAFGSSVSNYSFSKLSKAKPAEIDKLGSDLAWTLNALQNCPDDVKSEYDFGNTLVSLHTHSDRTGSHFEIVANGHLPAPAFAPYQVTIEIEAKIVPRPVPIPDAPTQYDYTCEVTRKNLRNP